MERSLEDMRAEQIRASAQKEQQGKRHEIQHQGQGGVHHQGDGHPAGKQHGGPDAQGMELLDGGLDVIAVAGQAADEGGQAEGVELGPGQVDGFLKHLLADVVAYVVGVAHPSRRLAASPSTSPTVE